MQNQTSEKKTDIKKISILAMMTALSYMLVVVIRIPFMPAAPYLNLDIKDIPIVLGGFIYGPLSSLLMSLVVSFIEMVTISDTGPIGFLMNFISTAAFVIPPAVLYKKKKSIKNAVIGLVIGCLFMTAMMLLWNYIVTPFYQKVPREVIKSMLLPVFLPFNIIKGAVNSALAFMLYKPLTDVMKKSGFVVKSEGNTVTKKSALTANISALLILAVTIIIMVVIYKS